MSIDWRALSQAAAVVRREAMKLATGTDAAPTGGPKTTAGPNEWEIISSPLDNEPPGPGWEPFSVTDDGVPWVWWRRRRPR